MRRTVNRILLGVVGAVLLVAGLLALIGGFDLGNRWGWLSLPSWWPWSSPDDVLLTASDRTRWTGESWWWPVVIAVLAVLLLGALWWLAAQFRTHVLHRVAVAGAAADEDGVQLRGRALSDALAAEAGLLPGVELAQARLVGRPSRPRAELMLTLAPEADPEEVLEDVHRRTITDARGSAGLAELPTTVRLRGAHPARGRRLG